STGRLLCALELINTDGPIEHEKYLSQFVKFDIEVILDRQILSGVILKSPQC
ncbi:hypothetical protein PanWU01x14_289930, partial [Parasponia andersonii]